MLELTNPKKIKTKTISTTNMYDLDKLISDFINITPIISILSIQYSSNMLAGSGNRDIFIQSAMIVYSSDK